MMEENNQIDMRLVFEVEMDDDENLLKNDREGYYEEQLPYWDATTRTRQIGLYKGSYIDGRKNGEWKSYTKEGNIFRQKNYKDGKLVDKVTSWYQNTNIVSYTGQYDDNSSRCGTWLWFYHDGTVRQVAEYKKSDLPNTINNYNLQGHLCRETLYIN